MIRLLHVPLCGCRDTAGRHPTVMTSNYGESCLSHISCLAYPTITKANPVDLGQLPLSNTDEHKSLSVFFSFRPSRAYAAAKGDNEMQSLASPPPPQRQNIATQDKDARVRVSWLQKSKSRLCGVRMIWTPPGAYGYGIEPMGVFYFDNLQHPSHSFESSYHLPPEVSH